MAFPTILTTLFRYETSFQATSEDASIMRKIFFDRNGTTQGPYESKELRTLAKAGIITPTTLVWKEGESSKIEARRISGLFPDAQSSDSQGDAGGKGDSAIRIDPEGEQLAALQSAAVVIGSQSLHAVRGQASQLISDLKSVDFQEEVFPVNKALVEYLLRDTVFWVVMGLAAVPLLISTIDRREYQLTAFALFFAVLWGVVFKSLIVKADMGWKPLVAALFFTGLVGVPALLFSYGSLLPKAYVKLSDSESGMTSLIGYVFQVGVCEELIKIVPVFAYLAWMRKNANPLGAILIGVFSGLGFAAFENMSYGQSAIFKSALLAKKAGIAGAAAGTQLAMVNVLLRSLSLVFCHAVITGIFAYFVTAGFASGKRFLAMVLIGLFVSASLHGAYDWLTGIQMTVATAVVVLSFVLFYAYLTKFKQLIAPVATES